MNCAVTLVAAATVTVHVPVPEHPPPDHPANVEPLSAVAVRVTEEPWSNSAAHVAPHVMPAGELLTLPLPVPDLATVTVCWILVNLAVTVVSLASVTTHLAVPEQPPPDQPAKAQLVAGVAVSVILVPDTCAVLVQVGLHLIPPTSLVTVPPSSGSTSTVSLAVLANVAVTLTSALILTEQGFVVVLHVVFGSPVTTHPVSTDPLSAVAVSVTTVSASYLAVQVEPQSILLSPDLTVPDPAPALATVSTGWTGSNISTFLSPPLPT